MIRTGNAGVSAMLTGAGRFQTRIETRGGAILADEPVEVGGTGTAPTPYELLSAALAACTTMTMRLYAERKGRELPRLRVDVTHSRDAGGQDLFTRRIDFAEPLDPEWRAKLVEIAEKCPVHRTLMSGFAIETVAGALKEPLPMPAEPADQHERDMEAVCAG
jgi:putative redox protein